MAESCGRLADCVVVRGRQLLVVPGRDRPNRVCDAGGTAEANCLQSYQTSCSAASGSPDLDVLIGKLFLRFISSFNARPPGSSDQLLRRDGRDANRALAVRYPLDPDGCGLVDGLLRDRIPARDRELIRHTCAAVRFGALGSSQ